MRSLCSIALAAMLAVPAIVSAQTATPEQPSATGSATPPATPAAASSSAAGQNAQQNSPADRKTKKQKREAKNGCIPGPAFQGAPDYCKNPYWEPKDWDYIRENNPAGR